jgi:23S rRNA (cytosine1962-C5)-methyltransferase
LITVAVPEAAARRLESGHAWVYRKECERLFAAAPGASGDNASSLAGPQEVIVTNPKGRRLGSALWDPDSAIPLRIYSRKPEELSEALLAQRLEEALAWRHLLIPAGCTGYRIVHGEADSLPGLILDRFGGDCSLQASLRNYTRLLPAVAGFLESRFAARSVAVDIQGSRQTLLAPLPETSRYEMNGLAWEANLHTGQKTGSFLDQRENYLHVLQACDSFGVTGRMADLFTSTGGFAIHAAKQFSTIHAIDSAPRALALAQRNATLNGVNHITWIESDVKRWLHQAAQSKSSYQLVVTDPPAFAKESRHRQDALRAYVDLNVRALRITARGGLLAAFSCSQNIDEKDFALAIREAAGVTGRSLSIWKRLSQSPDHREILTLPESSYLKGLLVRA